MCAFHCVYFKFGSNISKTFGVSHLLRKVCVRHTVLPLIQIVFVSVHCRRWLLPLFPFPLSLLICCISSFVLNLSLSGALRAYNQLAADQGREGAGVSGVWLQPCKHQHHLAKEQHRGGGCGPANQPAIQRTRWEVQRPQPFQHVGQ